MSMKLYVGNLSFQTSSEDLQQLFAQAGTVESASVVEDRETGRSRGFGFVEMATKEEGEAAIFRRLGMLPVFFGRGMIGANLPSLTYMLAFDDLAARERLWRNFGSDPEWQKLRSTPGLTDPEIVSNISNAILRPLPFSPIR